MSDLGGLIARAVGGCFVLMLYGVACHVEALVDAMDAAAIDVSWTERPC